MPKGVDIATADTRGKTLLTSLALIKSKNYDPKDFAGTTVAILSPIGLTHSQAENKTLRLQPKRRLGRKYVVRA